MKGKKAGMVAYSLVLACLVFTLGFLLGRGSGKTQIQVQTAQGMPVTEAAERLDLNTATAEELDELPGVGSDLAKQIVAYREKVGVFVSVEELRNISGVGESRFAALQDLVEVRWE